MEEDERRLFEELLERVFGSNESQREFRLVSMSQCTKKHYLEFED